MFFFSGFEEQYHGTQCLKIGLNMFKLIWSYFQWCFFGNYHTIGDGSAISLKVNVIRDSSRSHLFFSKTINMWILFLFPLIAYLVMTLSIYRFMHKWLRAFALSLWVWKVWRKPSHICKMLKIKGKIQLKEEMSSDLAMVCELGFCLGSNF